MQRALCHDMAVQDLLRVASWKHLMVRDTYIPNYHIIEHTEQSYNPCGRHENPQICFRNVSCRGPDFGMYENKASHVPESA